MFFLLFSFKFMLSRILYTFKWDKVLKKQPLKKFKGYGVLKQIAKTYGIQFKSHYRLRVEVSPLEESPTWRVCS